MGPSRYECIPSTLPHMPGSPMRHVLAVTGTPGTGKTTLTTTLCERVQGSECHSVATLAERCGAIAEQPDRTGARDVDVEGMMAAWSDLSVHLSSDLIIIDGHLSHLLPVDGAILLRCRPDVLRDRLEMRGWPSAKVEENVEAEFIGSIAADLVDGAVPCLEISTHDRDIVNIAHGVVSWLEKDLPSGGPSLDWLEGAYR